MMSPAQGDRRTNPRVVASLPILFEWQTQQGELCRARGITYDVSQQGVYCYLEQPLALDLSVQFHLVFPPELTISESLNFSCAGRVLRRENLGRRFGVAASIESRQAVGNGEPMAEPHRRAHPRIMPFASIAVEYPALRSVIRDLSSTGAYIEDARPLPVGRQLGLRLGGNGGLPEICLQAVVRRTEPYVGMAVEFVAIGKEADLRLHEFLGTNGKRR